MADSTKIKFVSAEKLGYYDGKIKEYIANADDVLEAALQAKIDAEATRAKAQEATNAAAAQAAQTAADNAQTAVDTLAEKVGEVPADSTVMDIITNIQENAYDDTEVRGLIDAEAKTARAAEKANADAIDAIEADYLKTADKEELQDNIDIVSGKVTTLVGTDANKSVRTIANEELAKQLIAEGAAESLNELQEIAAWIQSHPDDASAMNKAIDDLETLVGVLPEGVTATTIVGYIQEVVAAEKTRAEGVEDTLAEKIEALESSIGDGGSVANMIAEAVAAETEARETAVAEVQADADKGIADAAAALKAAQDAAAQATSLNNAMDERVAAVEAAKHTHKNLDLLETYTQTEANLADAVAKKHSHSNLSVLEGITAAKVTAWDAAEGNAKTFAQGLNDTMDGRVTTLEDWHENFEECTEDDVNALFTA